VTSRASIEEYVGIIAIVVSPHDQIAVWTESWSFCVFILGTDFARLKQTKRFGLNLVTLGQLPGEIYQIARAKPNALALRADIEDL
jgi:hypothetical protein